jgi:hypothetical protein
MNTLQTIPASFEGLSKSQIATSAKNAVDHILEHGGALQVAEILATMEQFIKDVRKDERFTDYVREEAGKWNGKYSTPSGTKIELCETSVSYDYSQDSKWVELKGEVDFLTKELKEHEEKLKTIPAGKLLVDDTTGEVLTGPARTSKSSYKISIAK